MTTKQPDWEAIHGLYRGGLLSIRAIAERFDVSDTAIRNKAKKNGWQRDLTDKVRQAVNAKVVRTEVRTSGSQSVPRTDDEIIEDVSSEAAAMVIQHRVYLSRWGSIAEKLAASMEGTEITADNQADFARALNAGVDAQLKVIKGERQAYNLDTETGDKTVSDLAALMDDLSKEA